MVLFLKFFSLFFKRQRQRQRQRHRGQSHYRQPDEQRAGDAGATGGFAARAREAGGPAQMEGDGGGGWGGGSLRGKAHADNGRYPPQLPP